MNALSNINWISVVVAAVLTFVLGGLWYGPLFGRAWQRASGVTEAQQKQASPGIVFGVSFALQLVAAIVLDLFIGAEAGFSFGLFAGLAAGLFWVATAFGVVYLFEQRPIRHWVVNAGYQVVAYGMMGAVLGIL